MAGEYRDSTRHLALFQKFSAAPHSFDFYQAVRLIECAFPAHPRIGESRRPQDDPVRFGQEPSAAFATSTLFAFVAGEDGRPPWLVENFFGMYGANGPLPLHLTEFVRDRVRNAGDRSFARFLDVFHHRLVSLFYRVWARAQPTVSRDRNDNDRFESYLRAFIGLSPRALHNGDSVPDAAKLSFAGLLARQSKCAGGLESVLREFFRVPVRILPFIPHWMNLPEELYTRLGRPDGSELGRTAVIGSRVWDLQSKFQVVIGPLTASQYDRFLPGQQSYQRLAHWICNYVGLECIWDAKLVLKRDEVPRLLLGFTGKLGWTTWLGTRLSKSDADDLVLARREL